MQKSHYLQVALEAVQAAEEVILHYYRQNLKIDLKTDITPVTIADRETEKTIREIISGNFPDHGFIGEEFGREDNGTEYHWVIDPIDGTKEFLRGIPAFGTQLALMKGSDFILGVSNSPLTKEVVYAEKGKGAFLNDTPLHVSSIDNLNESYILTGGVKYFARNNTLPQMLQLVEKARGNRIFGTLLGYTYVAQGKADAMIEMDTYLWDVAAFAIIVTEAGGKVTDPTGQPLSFTPKLSIVATNGLLHDQILAFFNS